MKRGLRTYIRKYHVPHDGNCKTFSKEDNIFGDAQNVLSMQLKIKKMVITINNPIYVNKESIDNNTPYTVDLHYRHNRYIDTLEGDKCEELVRQAIGIVNNST